MYMMLGLLLWSQQAAAHRGCGYDLPKVKASNETKAVLVVLLLIL